MEEKIIEEVELISNQMIDAIKEVVKIDSVEGESLDDAPFGIGVKQALESTLSIASELGLKTVNIDNYMGYASYGSGEEYVCAVGHLDVVPVGVGWKQPPFSAYEEEGIIYSRGILDNKGPILSCLFALHALQRLKLDFKHEIRIIFGCDEETGFKDLEYYLQKEKAPIMGFTPDCKYPVVYAERGRANFKITGSKEKLSDFFDMVNTYILNAKNNGERFGIDTVDKEFGMLEIRNYQIEYLENPVLHFSVSYPASVTCDEILTKIKNTLSTFTSECIHNFDPVYFDKDCFMVQTLVDTYERVTGEDGTPVTTTGGTYAKMMPNIVPFGPSFPGQKGIGHQPNEWMKIEDIITNAKIYALSLYRLAKG
ncbi:MAG: Sapep family Mn(2+)-dependent dipeptidase [Coprobacillaceae bacterium]